MADNKNICEGVEIAILSDSKLTQEQKNHIENCESCKALLSQVSSMKSDLKNFTIPGIREGQIADSVMANIKKQKNSVSFPKFKLTHHLGTAAAIAIILVAALVINNPSDNKNSQNQIGLDNGAPAKTESDDEGHYYMSHAPADDEEAGITAHLVPSSEGYGINSGGGSSGYSPSEDKIMTGFAPGSSYNAPSAILKANKESEIDSAEESELFADSANAKDLAPKKAVEEPFEAEVSFDRHREKLIAIFEGIEFGDNLEENISLANDKVYEVYGVENYYALSDYSSNEEFLTAIGANN